MELPFSWPPEASLTISEWLFAFLASMAIGMSKTGIKGIAVIVVTILALVFGGKASTGILLPLLIVGDIFGVKYYHRYAQWSYLYKLLPWMLAGVLLGVWVGKDLPETLFKRGMATIIILSTVMMFVWEKRKDKQVPDHWIFGAIMGLAAGFTTMVGNLAGAFTNLYFLAMQLPKNHFIGTAAWLFFIVNLFKVPFHVFVWKTITPTSLLIDVLLLPGILLGLFLGIWLVKRIKEQQYRTLILILTGIGAIVIIFR